MSRNSKNSKYVLDINNNVIWDYCPITEIRYKRLNPNYDPNTILNNNTLNNTNNDDKQKSGN